MGRADEYQFDYLDDNSRFADQINGALFHGRQVVKPEELEPADMQYVYLGKEAGKREEYKVIVDKARIWRGRLLHILAVENQTYVDYHMVLRNMLTESLGYRKQWKQKKNMHEASGDLAVGTDEYFSGMKKGEKFMPIITLVVYCGRKHSWDGARCLHELLEIDDELKEFVTNYKLNLYDCHEHDTFDEYHTGLRQLFEVIRYGHDKEKLRQVMEENREAYSKMDSDTRELLEVVSNTKFKEGTDTMKNEEKTYDMLKAFWDMKLEGVEEGRREGIKEGRREGSLERLVDTVCKKLRKNKPAELIAEELEAELSEIQKVIEAQQQIGSYDVEQICKVLLT